MTCSVVSIILKSFYTSLNKSSYVDVEVKYEKKQVIIKNLQIHNWESPDEDWPFDVELFSSTAIFTVVNL